MIRLIGLRRVPAELLFSTAGELDQTERHPTRSPTRAGGTRRTI
jgi:hypothetical protein